MVVTEFECRPINEDGDSIDVWHFDSKNEAIAAAKRHVADGGLAAVVEKYIRKYPMHLFNEPQKHTLLATFGNKEALSLGSWV
jgi:hypothetical protein